MCVCAVLVAKLDTKDEMVKKQEVGRGCLDPSLSAVLTASASVPHNMAAAVTLLKRVG